MKCTINELAKETGYSRNTVSKALRQHKDVSIRTREIIKRKAISMGYFTNEERESNHIDEGNILFLNIQHAKDSQFWSSVLIGIEMILSETDYQLTIATLSPLDIQNGTLPEAVYKYNTKAIILAEMNYKSIWEKLLQTDLPIVTIDAPKNLGLIIGKCDIIMMENHSNIEKIMQTLIQKGNRDFAFIGDLQAENTGLGFMERYYAFHESLRKNNLPINHDASIIKNTDMIFDDFNLIKKHLNLLTKLPDAFICGNDWLAIQLIYALQALGYRIPGDVNIIGFDNIQNSERLMPSLTTVNTPKIFLGKKAAQVVLERLRDPDMPFALTKYSTNLLIRESTKV